MKPADKPLAEEIKDKLSSFSLITPLPGILNILNQDCLVEQIIDSVRRIRYVTTIRGKTLSPTCADPTTIAFDPIKAAAFYKNQGNINEAFWMVFLATHFGKNLKTKWQLTKDVYSGLTDNIYWTWAKTSNSPEAFRKWLDESMVVLRQQGGFGNHRKYQSLKAYNKTGTGATVNSYIGWIGAGHTQKVQEIYNISGLDQRLRFENFYQSMNAVIGFGRTARFDYLTMVGKLKLADIEPGSTYMNGATGPLTGAQLLFGGKKNAKDLNALLVELEAHLGLYYGMQVLEDSLCNWQKNPSRYIHFGG